MDKNFTWRFASIALTGLIFAASCAPKSTPPPVDTVGTVAVQLAQSMLTQTAAAYTPTSPTLSSTPIPTETATMEPTRGEPSRYAIVLNFAPCYYGPGPSYVLESNISARKRVEILGRGSVEGWLIVMNPYFHQPCWMEMSQLKIDPNLDLSIFPVMTPGH